ncbi:hypothetical protein CRG98_029082 [Punica granatum]|uniref:Uncharacterized protein n=1 Tax=Punica granatum TaxID=22663 RepID=A0A2I0J2S1_PUNGR|nr:hypothetical protein CRG98_029082 [Punica granatum]
MWVPTINSRGKKASPGRHSLKRAPERVSRRAPSKVMVGRRVPHLSATSRRSILVSVRSSCADGLRRGVISKQANNRIEPEPSKCPQWSHQVVWTRISISSGPACALCHGLGMSTFSGTHEKESPLVCLQPEGRGPVSCPSLGIWDTPSLLRQWSCGTKNFEFEGSVTCGPISRMPFRRGIGRDPERLSSYDSCTQSEPLRVRRLFGPECALVGARMRARESRCLGVSTFPKDA